MPEPVRVTIQNGQLLATLPPAKQFCPYCGGEAGAIGNSDESADFCHECEHNIEGQTIPDPLPTLKCIREQLTALYDSRAFRYMDGSLYDARHHIRTAIERHENHD